MLFVLFCHMTERTPPSCGCKCDSCAGIWISNIGKVNYSRAQITSLACKLICASTPCSRITSSGLNHSSSNILLLLGCQCSPRICRITGHHASTNPRTQPSLQPTSPLSSSIISMVRHKMSSLPSLLTIPMASLVSPTVPLSLVNSPNLSKSCGRPASASVRLCRLQLQRWPLHIIHSAS